MGRSWQSTLSVDSREEAEARLSELEYSWEWMEQDELRVTSPTLPAVRELDNGKRSFFNQLIAAFKGWKDSRNDPSKSITHGDGSSLDPSEIERVCELADGITFDLPWQAGDLALVDNYLCMHGRRSFQGTRKVLASLAAAVLSFIKPVKPYVLGKQFDLQCHYYPKARFVRLPLFNFSPKSGSFTTFFFYE